MHRIKWSTQHRDSRNIVGTIVDLGEVIHLHPTGKFKQTYKIIIDKKLVDVPAKDGHFIIKKKRITTIEDYPKKGVLEAK